MDYFHAKNFYKWPAFWMLVLVGIPALVYGLWTGQLSL